MPLGNVSKGKIQSWDFFFFTKWKESGGNWFQQDKTQTKEGLGTDKNLKEWGFSTDDIRRFIFLALSLSNNPARLAGAAGARQSPFPGQGQGFSSWYFSSTGAWGIQQRDAALGLTQKIVVALLFLSSMPGGWGKAAQELQKEMPLMLTKVGRQNKPCEMPVTHQPQQSPQKTPNSVTDSSLALMEPLPRLHGATGEWAWKAWKWDKP